MNECSRSLIRRWPRNPQESAQRLIQLYGEPNETTASKLIWYDTHDGWKRTELSSEEIPHDFPDPHTDYLEQVIDYRVPVDKFSALAAFDGSVVVERTKGELSARCGGTAMNFAAINLAHDIVTDRRTVAEARAEYTRLFRAYREGDQPPYTRCFQFPVAKGATGDLDTGAS